MYMKVVLLQRIGRDLERESEKFSSRLPLSENAKRIFLRNKAKLRDANHTGERATHELRAVPQMEAGRFFKLYEMMGRQGESGI